MIAATANYYDTLNIPRDANKDTIKRAYFSLVKIYSPDKDPEGFRVLREAYENLYDEQKRAEYDAIFAVPDYLQKDLMVARELMQQTKFKQAIKMLEGMFRRNPQETEVSLLLVQAYINNRNSGKAEKVCEKILQGDPDNLKALLLLAGACAYQGHNRKADEYYRQATIMAPANPEPWIAYLRFLLMANPETVPEVIRLALPLSAAMFKSDYMIYLYSAIVCHKQHDQMTATKCLHEFTQYFLADKRLSPQNYDHAVKGLKHFTYQEEFFADLESILPALLDSGHRQPNHDEHLNFISRSVGVGKLKFDCRIDNIFAILTESLLDGCDCVKCQEDRLYMEANIVFELVSSRQAVKILRDEYPEFFKLHQKFYLDVLNPKKGSYLRNQYHAEFKGLLKKEKKLREAGEESLFDFLDLDEDEEGIFEALDDSWELPDQPYVREAPKVRRNDLCPCGSGKKYKKCCGKDL